MRIQSKLASSLVAGMVGTCLSIVGILAAEPFHLDVWPAGMPHPSFQLIDGDRQPRRLADYEGAVSIVFFGFTHCPDACPATLLKLSLIMRQLGPLANHVHVLFITVDPERDTPGLLKSYVAGFDPRFIGLTGSVAAVNAAADSFSGRYAKVVQGDDYTIDHSNGVYVLDDAGRLRLVGTLNRRIEDWVHDLKLLAADSRPTQ